jgi:hypothetical protein
LVLFGALVALKNTTKSNAKIYNSIDHVSVVCSLCERFVIFTGSICNFSSIVFTGAKTSWDCLWNAFTTTKLIGLPLLARKIALSRPLQDEFISTPFKFDRISPVQISPFNQRTEHRKIIQPQLTDSDATLLDFTCTITALFSEKL